MAIPNEKKCPMCKEVKDNSLFYRRRNGSDLNVYCKACSIEEALNRQRKFKRNCIEYKGGKCEMCGYDRCDAALEFHHKNPSEKDFSLAHVKLTSFSDKIRQELDKCMILCANCHREEHIRITEEKKR